MKSTLNGFDIGVTSVHWVSLGFTWCHSVSLGVTRFHLVSLGVTWTRCYVTRFHSVSLGVTWCHSVSLWRHSVSLGFTRFHRSQVVVDSQSLLCLSDGVFFLRSEKKRPLGVTWIHFIAKKQVFQEVAAPRISFWLPSYDIFLSRSPHIMSTSPTHFFIIHFWREAEVSPISGKYGGEKK